MQYFISLGLQFVFEYKARMGEEGPFNLVLLAVVFQGLLTALGFMWTYQLAAKFITSKEKT